MNPTLTLELHNIPSTLGGGVRVVISLAGRDGSFSRRWFSPSGRLDESALDDLKAWCSATVDNWYTTTIGAQTGLFSLEGRSIDPGV